jgi:hypothetical protein
MQEFSGGMAIQNSPIRCGGRFNSIEGAESSGRLSELTLVSCFLSIGKED